MGLRRKPPAGNVRRVSSNGHSLRGVVVSKAGRHVQFESLPERALLLRLDRHPGVRDYGSQPERFEFADGQGRPHTYTPDFIVWWHSGATEIHEVTLSHRRLQPHIRRREAAAQAICDRRGWRYVVHTEHTLPGPTELANLLALYLYRPCLYARDDIRQAADARLEISQPADLRCLAATIAADLHLPAQHVLASLGHLLWHGQLNTDLQKLIFVDGEVVPGTQVWRAPEGEMP